jgi:hypothetical protein
MERDISDRIAIIFNVSESQLKSVIEGMDFNYYTNQVQQKKRTLPVYYVLFSKEAKKITSDSMIFYPGIVTVLDELLECPILFSQLELVSLEQVYRPSKLEKISIRIYSKHFDSYRELQVVRSISSFVYESVFSKYFVWLVNLINNYVARNYSIEELNIDRLVSQSYPLRIKSIFNMINNLNVKIFEYGYDRGVGKDSGFEETIELYSVPIEKSIRDLFINAMNDYDHYVLIKDEADCLEFKGGTSYAYSPAYGKEEITSDSNVLKIKDALKLYCATNFDAEKAWFDSFVV